jgi:cob(I)alamin adenosyltransferase
MLLGLARARRLVDSAVHGAVDKGLAVSVTVVDAGGHVVMKVRMDGAPLGTVNMSENKAYTAAALNRATGDLSALVQPGQPLYGLNSAEAGRIVALGGGIPVRLDGQLVGGIGVSGGSVEQDVEIAELALQHIGKL